jgi:hypothetical protein
VLILVQRTLGGVAIHSAHPAEWLTSEEQVSLDRRVVERLCGGKDAVVGEKRSGAVVIVMTWICQGS